MLALALAGAEKPSIEQAHLSDGGSERPPETRVSPVTLSKHLMEAADRRADRRADDRTIEQMIYGRLSPGLRASLKHRHAALQEEIIANLF